MTLTKRPSTVQREDAQDLTPESGQWVWFTAKAYDGVVRTSLMCVSHVGSNYVEVTGVGGHSERVHADQIVKKLAPAPDAETFIAQTIADKQRELRQLMARVQEVTTALALTPSAGSETQALAVVGSSQPIAQYEQALVQARDTDLPKLFQSIRDTTESLGRWLSVPMLPLQAQVTRMRPVMDTIKHRIFHVKLYAGLTETVQQIMKGHPAPATEPVHLFQRRAYMDEECLAEYEAGGMDYRSIEGFDAWLARPSNLNRLLPFPRCVLAFRVRRYDKERQAADLGDFIRINAEQQADKTTFLYIRNGENLYRLDTEIDFGASLFPDLDAAELSGPLYARVFGSSVREIVPEHVYLGIVEKDDAELKAYRLTTKAGRKLIFEPRPDAAEYVKWSPETIYYDDIGRAVQQQMDEHNRLVLVLQGLFDRSTIFHPHPGWQIWNAEHFAQALKLVYDDSRTLTNGAAPDFEAYRQRLNASLKLGCVTVGQETAWTLVEGERESARRARDWRRKDHYEVKYYRPYGNPGPGMLAQPVRASKRSCAFSWTRERTRWTRWGSRDPLPCSLVVPSSELLNVSAYTPGDFRQFFADPRTRANYLQWAPLLLAAEDYHAGKRKVIIYLTNQGH